MTITGIKGIEYGIGGFFLINENGTRHESTRRALKVYAMQAYAKKDIADWEFDGETTTVHFGGVYGPLSDDDVEELSRPTGVTGLLRALEVQV